MTEAIQEFGFDCKIRKLSQKTISNYQKQLKYLQRFLESEFGVKDVEGIRSIHIKQFLAMKDDQGCKARYHARLEPPDRCDIRRITFKIL
ncbi:MAG: site-specific integrase [Clostridia bacterium]|nr:site-specific integrase [Clostridia bacterium]